MSEILILKSINGEKITNALVDSWFDTNEMFIARKNFSPGRYSLEIAFIDEESKIQREREKQKRKDFHFYFKESK